jgi:ribonuclease HII
MTKDDSSRLIAGLDECGMGCLAGPLVVTVAAFQEGQTPIAGVKDSKKCTKVLMAELAPKIVERAAFIGIGHSDSQTIERLGIKEAWNLAANMALERAPDSIKLLIVDGVRGPPGYMGKKKVEPKADVNYWQVSAASIVGKFIRDITMLELDSYYPGYGWGRNAGYGTAEHITAVRELGMTPFHRKAFTEKALRTKGLC